MGEIAEFKFEVSARTREQADALWGANSVATEVDADSKVSPQPAQDCFVAVQNVNAGTHELGEIIESFAVSHGGAGRQFRAA